VAGRCAVGFALNPKSTTKQDKGNSNGKDKSNNNSGSG